MKWHKDFPLKFNQHVIVDRSNGATFVSSEHSPIKALAEVCNTLMEDESWRDSQNAEVLSKDLMWLLTSPRPPEDNIIRTGSLETQAYCTHQKNMALVIRTLKEAGQVDLADWIEDQLTAALNRLGGHSHSPADLDQSEMPPEVRGIMSQLESMFGPGSVKFAGMVKDEDQE